MYAINSSCNKKLSRMAKRLAVLAVFYEGNKKFADYGWSFLINLGRITIPSTYRVCEEFARMPNDAVVDTVEKIYAIALYNLENNEIDNPSISRTENVHITAKIVAESYSLKHEINYLEALAVA